VAYYNLSDYFGVRRHVATFKARPCPRTLGFSSPASFELRHFPYFDSEKIENALQNTRDFILRRKIFETFGAGFGEKEIKDNNL
jgi:hypothetical protein